MNKPIKLREGVWRTESHVGMGKSYFLEMYFKETAKSYIMQALLSEDTNTLASNLMRVFTNKSRIVISKAKAIHGIVKYSGTQFTFYPQKSNTPYVFVWQHGAYTLKALWEKAVLRKGM